MENCPYCGKVQEKPLFNKSDEAGAVVQVECESCNRPIKVTLKVVETYVVSLPDDVVKKVTTVGQRVRKNPRWDWCICGRTPRKARKPPKCLCKDGHFEVKEVKRSTAAHSEFFVTVSNENGPLDPLDSGYFLPVEEEARPVGNLPARR